MGKQQRILRIIAALAAALRSVPSARITWAASHDTGWNVAIGITVAVLVWVSANSSSTTSSDPTAAPPATNRRGGHNLKETT